MNLILQVTEATKAITDATAWGESVQIKGFMGVVIITLAVWIWFLNKKLSKVQDDRLNEAKDTFVTVQAIAEKFMIHTNKMILVMELFKNRTNNGT